MNFENKYIADCDIHYSRIISSWLNVGGSLRTGKDKNDFLRWLIGMGVLTYEQIDDIYNMATNGKLEWESNARLFLNSIK